MAKINVKLKQKPHNGEGPYFSGTGKYFGFQFEQLGEELVAEIEEKDIASLIDAKKVIKLSAAVYKELVEEAKETEE